MEGLPRVPQLPPPHHPDKARDAPQEHPAVAAEEGEGARRGGADGRGSEHEGHKRGMDGHRFLKGGEEKRAERGMAGIVVLEDLWVDVAVVAVGRTVQNQHLSDKNRRHKRNN